MPPLLDLRELHVTLRSGGQRIRALRGVDLTLARGETLGLVGESGSGKSIACLSLMGLLPKGAERRQRRMELDGQDLALLGEAGMARLRGNRIAMIFQEPMTALHPCLTIGTQLTEVYRRHVGSDAAEARDRAVAMLERVGIPDGARRLAQYPHQLSGGLRQRVMIAMALMCRPDLIIADEPTTALDVTVQAQILRLLRDLQQQDGMALLFVTHDLGVVAGIADRIAVMYAGEVIETGPTRGVLRRPVHPYTQGLIACLPGGARARLTPIPGTVPSLAGDLPGCAFRTRCRFAEPDCAETIPSAEAAPGHLYRCRVPPPARRSGEAPAIHAGAAALRDTHHAPLLSARGLRRVYRLPRRWGEAPATLAAVDGVDLDLWPGETLGLVGESGSGKSTLGRMILGLETPDAGTIALEGAAISGLDTKRIARRILPVFQDPYASLNPRRSVLDITTEPLAIHGIGDRPARRLAARDMLERVGLPFRLHHRMPGQLSGGQRQRVAIARALVLHPAIVVCDEPSSALDVSIQAQILNLLLDLQQEFGLAYLFISHDLAVIRHMATRVAVMHRGRIVETRPAAALFAAPEHPYTRTLLDSVLTPDMPSVIPTQPHSHAGATP